MFPEIKPNAGGVIMVWDPGYIFGGLAPFEEVLEGCLSRHIYLYKYPTSPMRIVYCTYLPVQGKNMWFIVIIYLLILLV